MTKAKSTPEQTPQDVTPMGAFMTVEGERPITPDPGNTVKAIPITAGFAHCDITTAGAETRTIAAPIRSGQLLTVFMKIDGGNCVITVAHAINATGNNTITLDDVGDGFTLVSYAITGGAYKWKMMANHDSTLSTV